MNKDSEFYNLLVNETIDWIKKNREIYRPLASELFTELKEKFKPYFPEEILSEARIFKTKVLPEFDFLNKHGFTEFTKKALSLEYNSGIIFIDTLVISNLKNYDLSSLVFYLLVHSTSYKLIGKDKFIRLYIQQSLEQNYNLKKIPIEQNAEDLTSKFQKGEIFNIEDQLLAFFSE